MNKYINIPKNKLKFWIIGILVSLLGVFMYRIGYKYFEFEYYKFIKPAGIIITIIGLYIVMLGVNRTKAT